MPYLRWHVNLRNMPPLGRGGWRPRVIPGDELASGRFRTSTICHSGLTEHFMELLICGPDIANDADKSPRPFLERPMADHKPAVIIGGTPQDLPSGDGLRDIVAMNSGIVFNHASAEVDLRVGGETATDCFRELIHWI